MAAFFSEDETASAHVGRFEGTRLITRNLRVFFRAQSDQADERFIARVRLVLPLAETVLVLAEQEVVTTRHEIRSLGATQASG